MILGQVIHHFVIHIWPLKLVIWYLLVIVCSKLYYNDFKFVICVSGPWKASHREIES